MTDTTADSRWRQLIDGSLLVEAVFVIGFVAVADLVVLMVERPPVRAVFGLLLLLFFPGYAVLTVLFPGRPPRTRYSTFDPLSRSVNGTERLALSFGMSLALIPPIALALWTVNDQGFGVRAILAVFTGLTVLGMVYGVYRRLQLPLRKRYRIPVGHWITELRATGFDGGATRTLLRFGLALSVVLAMSTLGYAILVPNQSASYTHVSLLTRDTTGDLTAANYSNASNGDELVISIKNNERNSISYTTIVRIQRVEIAGNRTIVRSSRELQRLRTTVAAGETEHQTHSVSLSMNGEHLRLQYLVYKGEPPDVTTKANAYRTLFLWMNTTAPTNTTTTTTTTTNMIATNISTTNAIATARSPRLERHPSRSDSDSKMIILLTRLHHDVSRRSVIG